MTIYNFALYTDPNVQSSDLYALSTNEVYKYDFTFDEFGPTIYTFLKSGGLPYVVVPWYDQVYVTKRNSPLVKLKGDSATEIAGAPGARYGIIANNHLLLANTSNDVSNYPIRVQWSDLYAPEDFEIREESEADYFELDPDDKEITGLSYQRGNVVIYTRNAVWIGQYRPDAQTFRFEPLYNGIGSIYHGSVIRVKDLDFFIGVDNFYALNGLQLEPIGDAIWTRFEQTNASINLQDTLIALDYQERNEVHWIYNKVGGGRWSVVYNYKESKWSERDPQDVYCALFSKFALRGTRVINQYTDIINDVTGLINGDWQFSVSTVKNIFGGSNTRIYSSPSTPKYTDADNNPIYWELETFETFFETLADKKEIDQLTLFYSGLGTPNIELLVGTRDNQLSSVVWSAPVEMDDQLPGRATFHFRNLGVGKLIRFKIRYYNTATDYVEQMTNLSIHYLSDGSDQPQQ